MSRSADGSSGEAPELARKLALVEAMAQVGHWRYDFRSGKVTWSPEVYRIHGVSPDTFDPNLDSVVGAYHPDDQPILQEFIRRARMTGEGYEFVLRLQRLSDNATRIVTAKAEVETDAEGAPSAMFGVFQDVTERELQLQRLSAALQETDAARAEALKSEARYRLLADHATDIIVHAGRDGIIHYASPACRMLGVTPEQALGRPTLDFVAPEDRAYAARVISDLFSGAEPDASVRREYRVVRADGSRIWMEGNPSLVRDGDGEPVEFITSFRDVTARRKMEDELALARDAAESAMAAKAEFLANVSHELRTPLTSIIGFARVLEQRLGSDADAARYAHAIGDAGGSLLAMVNELLDMAQLDAQPPDLCAAPFGLRDCVRRVIDLVAECADEKGLELVFSVDKSLPDQFIGDAAWLRRVLLNLVANAIKFTEAGSVRVVVEPSGDMVSFRVIDTGVGLALDQKSRVFQRFVQADGGATRKHGGAGLGLAISQKLVDLMGGSIGVESTEGRGSEFWFKIRLPPALPGVAVPGPACSILVIEDQKAIQDLLVALLTPFGHEVDVAGDGLDGLSALRSTQYDIIIMDAHMPIVSGAAATFMIRHLEGRAANTPIIALTADTSPQTAAAFLEAGADACVTKPIEIERLLDAIARLSVATPQRPTIINALATLRG